ncbi:MAG: Ig-like domain-containing protein [Gemmatimonadetes bacterium]|nr:Ig-like domain-containing protein [Gemmatimonadota bacterium]
MKIWARAVLGLALLGGVACEENEPNAVAASELASVVPPGGATGVDPNGPIVVEFTHAVGTGMEQYVVLHEGTVTGPVVPGTWSWSADRTRLTFTPASPLQSQTRYTLHIGGGMRDADGHTVGLERHGGHMGGQWATGEMMTDGMMGGGWMGGGMMADSTMMGAGWRHANGSYGMVFSFITS